MTDSTGTVVWAADYKPFGEATITVSTITNNLRFPGQYFDAETGLNYNLNRDYNPAIARYLTPDFINLGRLFQYKARQSSNVELAINGIAAIIAEIQFDPQEQNLYAYVQNNPVNWIDPEGLKGKGTGGSSVGSGIASKIGDLPGFNMGGEWAYGFKKVCKRIYCDKDKCEPNDKGPWMVKDSKSCYCVEYEVILYKW